MALPEPPPCAHCGATTTALTCTCRACPDVSWSCACAESSDALLAREGLCDGCHAAGCGETLADFPRCRRLAPPSGGG